MTLQLLSLSQCLAIVLCLFNWIAPQSWLPGNLNGLFPHQVHPSFTGLLAVLINMYVFPARSCVIETIHQKPIIGGLVALLNNNTTVNPL